MSIQSTKEQLLRHLNDESNKVIALTGKWGTGKSFLWDQVRTEATQLQIKQSLSVSLFGVKTLEQVKVMLIQEAISMDKKLGFLSGGIGKTISTTFKALEGVHKSFTIFSDWGSFAAPIVLKSKLIILDDIERKHASLDIDEVLGFIDNFSKKHQTRFVLILNSDKLCDGNMWQTLREKVIDHELQLRTTPEEAFKIASIITPCQYSERILAPINLCGVTNIRIIRKVIKTVDMIIGSHDGLNEDVLARVIPSTVLLGAIHYQGITNGPDFDFVLSFGKVQDFSEMFAEENNIIPQDDQFSQWSMLLGQLGILSCDNYEHLVVDFLESGLFDVSEIEKIITGYILDAEKTATVVKFHNFQRRVIWDHHSLESDILAQGAELAEKAHFIDASNISFFAERVSNINGGEIVANNAVANWIEAFRLQEPNGFKFDHEYLEGNLHPDIKEAIQSLGQKPEGLSSILQACIKISTEHGWGRREEMAFKNATVEDIEYIIRTSSIGDLQTFMYQMLKFVGQKGDYTSHFGTALENFVQACKNICSDKDSKRLAKLIAVLFKDANESSLLT